MANLYQQSKPTRKRGPSPGMFGRAFRKALNKKVDPNSKNRRIDHVADNLCAIASSDQTSLGLQAVKILISQSGERPIDLGSAEEFQSEVDREILEQKTDEELDAEIEALDTEIKELQQALASAPTGNS